MFCKSRRINYIGSFYIVLHRIVLSSCCIVSSLVWPDLLWSDLVWSGHAAGAGDQPDDTTLRITAVCYDGGRPQAHHPVAGRRRRRPLYWMRFDRPGAADYLPGARALSAEPHDELRLIPFPARYPNRENRASFYANSRVERHGRYLGAARWSAEKVSDAGTF